MAKLKQKYPNDGFFGIGILHSQNIYNIGTLWRSAYILGASFIFTIDKRYKKQSSDVTRSWQRIPLYHYNEMNNLLENIPYDTQLIAVEMDEKAVAVNDFQHPHRAIYLLGNEQNGLPPKIIEKYHGIIKLPGEYSLNVSVAGSIVMYDRVSKAG